MYLQPSPAHQKAAALHAAARDEARARHRASVMQRAVDWAIANPAEMAWIDAHMESNDFARSLAETLNSRGGLSEAQVEAIRRNLGRTRAAEQAPAVTVDRIEAAFDVAREHGVKKPAMRLDTFVFKAAGSNSSNPGAIYVTQDGEYLGKVMGGKFLKVRECTDDQQARIVAAASNPDEAAKAYGRRTGTCSICGRELTAEESIERFIGPICASKYGM